MLEYVIKYFLFSYIHIFINFLYIFFLSIILCTLKKSLHIVLSIYRLGIFNPGRRIDYTNSKFLKI